MTFDKDEEWNALLEKEHDLRTSLFRSAETGEPTAEGARAWWASVAEVMALTAELEGRAQRPFPIELAQSLSRVAGYLAVGVIPEIVADTGKRGKPAIGPTEARHISYATAYIQLSERGEVEDLSPVSTVRSLYDVKRQTVQNWKKRPIVREVAAKMHDAVAIEKCMRSAAQYYRAAQTRRYLDKTPSQIGD